MGWSFQIDSRAIGLIRDDSLGKLLGTAFSFVRPHWFVTAKHVVVEHGLLRQNLVLLPNTMPPTTARVLFVHPEVDLAVIEVDKLICERPLFPGHHAFAGANGLISAGYAPSKRHPNGGPVVYLTEVVSFEVQVRERVSLNEETIIFPAPESEGGHSGGPIFGPGGGVVGAIIENFHDGERLVARGTNLAPLVDQLVFGRRGG